MKLFISWSGEKSKAVARGLHQWITDVINAVEPWMSELDIPAGARSYAEIAKALEGAGFGVVCLTKGNQQAPWLLFEAGAAAKQVEGSHLCPYLIDLEPLEVNPPLSQFQMKKADRQGTWELMSAINKALGEEAVPEKDLQRRFELWWDQLQKVLDGLPSEGVPEKDRRSAEDMIQEILEIVRRIDWQVSLQGFQPVYLSSVASGELGSAGIHAVRPPQYLVSSFPQLEPLGVQADIDLTDLTKLTELLNNLQAVGEQRDRGKEQKE